ncbi:hypothetical protein BCR35DRAFT_334445 [Leucosporidium creatinivorum]|uniref:Uncharacterized protein n=1 Tax=Leucosporidium creatinivorum TaxID=106004 RepID=A0A1Y2E8P4_9BASI|nr:hypothetical protein BCR35DRAFT_334445 [Leucosporidium creatinivorum]
MPTASTSKAARTATTTSSSGSRPATRSTTATTEPPTPSAAPPTSVPTTKVSLTTNKKKSKAGSQNERPTTSAAPPALSTASKKVAAKKKVAARQALTPATPSSSSVSSRSGKNTSTTSIATRGTAAIAQVNSGTAEGEVEEVVVVDAVRDLVDSRLLVAAGKGLPCPACDELTDFDAAPLYGHKETCLWFWRRGGPTSDLSSSAEPAPATETAAAESPQETPKIVKSSGGSSVQRFGSSSTAGSSTASSSSTAGAVSADVDMASLSDPFNMPHIWSIARANRKFADTEDSQGDMESLLLHAAYMSLMSEKGMIWMLTVRTTRRCMNMSTVTLLPYSTPSTPPGRRSGRPSDAIDEAREDFLTGLSSHLSYNPLSDLKDPNVARPPTRRV